MASVRTALMLRHGRACRLLTLGHAARGFLSASVSSSGVERDCRVRASETLSDHRYRSPACIGLRGPGATAGSGRISAPFSVFSRVPRTAVTARLSQSRRALSALSESESQENLFKYTSGRWVYNEALRMKEMTTIFNVDGLARLAAESVGQTAADVVSFTKFAEGWSNRAFLVVLRDGRQVVARIPYPVTVPKYLAVASEVATIQYMRRHGIPAPEIYGYSPDAHNDAEVPYIMMEFVQGPTLHDVWDSLRDEEVISIVRQITQLEAQMMSLEFPAGGSLYFTRDLEDVAPGLGVPLEDSTFCVGPDTAESLWYGRRAELDVYRGPYPNAESVLPVAAHKEITYLEHFGQPVQPRRRETRTAYRFQKQSPTSHVELLQRYLSITPSLVPKEPALRRFCIRHPDLQYPNIVVARSPDSGCKIVSLLDWQHTSILPMFLLAGVPPSLQYSISPFSEFRVPPCLPHHFSTLSPREQQDEQHDYRGRLALYHYLVSMRESNRPHYNAYSDSLHRVRSRLSRAAGAAWEGESHDLKVALIQATQMWEKLAGWDVPCPLEFDEEDLRATATTAILLQQEVFCFGITQRMCGIGENGHVRNDNYEASMACVKALWDKEFGIPKDVDDPRSIVENWPWNDMDEEVYGK